MTWFDHRLIPHRTPFSFLRNWNQTQKKVVLMLTLANRRGILNRSVYLLCYSRRTNCTRDFNKHAREYWMSFLAHLYWLSDTSSEWASSTLFDHDIVQARRPSADPSSIKTISQSQLQSSSSYLRSKDRQITHTHLRVIPPSPASSVLNGTSYPEDYTARSIGLYLSFRLPMGDRKEATPQVALGFTAND